MKLSEKKKIVKRHYESIKKCNELERSLFMVKLKQRQEALKWWKDKMKICS